MKRSDYDKVYRPKARSRLVPGQSLRRHAWLRVGAFGSGAARRARFAVRPPRSYGRRCIVQARYVQQGGVVSGKPVDLQASARRHLAYIEREGVERDGSAGRLYSGELPNQQSPTPDVRSDLAQPLEGEKHQFRFIVSPADAGELDLTEYVREWMGRVECDLGRRLIWGAVNHYDTAHPHAHVVVRGLDRNGREVRFEPEYIKRGARARAEEIATEWLGPRSELEYRQQLEREVEQQRYTTLDRGIAAKAQGGAIRHEDLSEVQGKRLHFLEALGLAQRLQGGAWGLQADWVRTLQRLGEKGDIIKQMHAAMRGVDSSRFVVCGDQVPSNPLEGDLICGRVTAVGLRDNVPDGLYACVETVRGSGYYIPLYPSQQVREGNLVTLRRWTDQRGRPRLSVDATPLSLERQVSYVGPTWLDAAAPSGASGLAQEVLRLRQAREAFLLERGLKRGELRTAERRRLIEHYARKLGKEAARKLDGFEGRVVELHQAPSGVSYAVVANERETVLVRATGKMRALVGRRVKVTFAEVVGRDREARSRRIEVQPLEHDR